MIVEVMHQLHKKVEHRLKDLGLYTGITIALLSLVTWYLDVYVIKGTYISGQNCDKINGINVVLVSVLVGILLTTFSVVFVVMQLASSQFSPRILRHFLHSDTKVQQFIGLFIGAIAFVFLPPAFSALFNKTETILQCSTVGALVLSFYCLLVRFPGIIAHLSDNMNVASITSNIKNNVIIEIETAYKNTWNPGDKLQHIRAIRNKALPHLTIGWPGKSGYIGSIDYEKLVKAYRDVLKDGQWPIVAMYQKPIVGEFLISNTTVVLFLALSSSVSAEDEKKIVDHFSKMVANSFDVNKYRSYTQDVNFGVRKLVDIGIKAISPAVNDPTTCLNCIDYLGEIVQKIATKSFPSTNAQQLNESSIFINEFNFEEFVDFCFDQIYFWGKEDPTVVRRLINTISQIVPTVQNPYHLKVLIREVEEMELGNVYHVSPRNNRHTLEQVNAIIKEYQRFVEKAKAQITHLMDVNKEETATIFFGNEFSTSFE